jgi:iron only hydrogenase large subunit-like protein
MMGAMVKRYMAAKLGMKPEDICLVGIMPCTAKKGEAERAEHRRPGEGQDVDYVITTREFGHMLRCVAALGWAVWTVLCPAAR